MIRLNKWGKEFKPTGTMIVLILSLRLSFEIYFFVAGWNLGRLFAPRAEPGLAGGYLITVR